MVKEKLMIEYSYRIDEQGEIKERITEKWIANGEELETSYEAPVAPFMQALVDATVEDLKIPKETALGWIVSALKEDMH